VNASPEELGFIAIKGNGHDNLYFFAANRLTEETAFGLLHLLHHLHETVFTYCYNCVELNPRVLDLLPGDVGAGGKTVPYRLKCSTLCFEEVPTELEEFTQRVSFEKVNIFNDSGNLGEAATVFQYSLGAADTCNDFTYRMGDYKLPMPVPEFVDWILRVLIFTRIVS